MAMLLRVVVEVDIPVILANNNCEGDLSDKVKEDGNARVIISENEIVEKNHC